MAYENGTTMSDIEIAEAFLLSDSLVKLCDAIGAKAGTAEYVRKSIAGIRSENLALREALVSLLPLYKEFVDTHGSCDHSVGICICQDLAAIQKAQDALDAANGMVM